MTVQWLDDRPRALGAVQWLGEYTGQLGFLFSESTSSECMSNLYNQDACNQLCYAIGITGYGAVLITPCQNQCMIEMCGQGVLPPCKLPPSGLPCNPLATQKEMQKAGTLISPCFKACMDAYPQEDIGTDEDALKAAAKNCLSKCGIVPAVRASSSTKPTGTAPTPKTPPSKTPSSTTPTPTTTTKAAAGGGLILIGLAVAAAAAYALTGGFK